MKRLVLLLPYLAATSLLAACGGGSSGISATPSAPANTSSNQAAQLMGVTFSGTNTLDRQRVASLSGTTITAKLNGTVVGTGTLDANGHAVITFSTSVPRGSTLVLTAGTTTLTVTLAKAVPATTVTVTATASGFTILASGDPTGTGNAAPSMTDNDAEDMDEDHNGNVMDVDNPTLTTLPATLQVTIVAACGGIVISPNAAGILSIRVREQTDDRNNDDDSNAKLDVRGAFTAPATFPIVSTAARLRVEVFGQANEQGPEIVEIRAPVSAVTAGATAPATCPAAFPGTQVTASPSPSPLATM
jgi:hypothetical protein